MEAFKTINFKSIEQENFYDRLKIIYIGLQVHLQNFRQNWLEQLSLLSLNEKQIGREKEKIYFEKIYLMIISFMDADKDIKNINWDNTISKINIARFIFDNMLICLKRGDSCEFLIEITKKVLSN